MAKVIFYGRFADLMGRERDIAVGEGVRLETMISDLSKENDAFADAVKAPAVKFAVNNAVAPLSTVIKEKDEVAVLPPFSGG